ncbi:hypothetical protein NP233_g12433 [Leucocoprinus birnbaumii]|uniref:Uncharacterized protein n=1 Tax=Leucocoprinus birnbaumii TaxID=56174 RepID=A0AAD5YQ03_9AGAR|nr:hypothetical protein NP233_g12433 [Leucocoprinus birnbaumii]
MFPAPKPRSFARDELVRILNGMDISLLADTKLNRDKLYSKLCKGLDAAQRYRRVFPCNNVDPLDYQLWPKGRRLAPFFQRNQKPGDHWMKSLPSNKIPNIQNLPVAHEKLFVKMIEQIDDMSDDWDSQNRHLSFMLRDDDTLRIIFLRILSVHEVTQHIPLVFVGYMVVTGLDKIDYDRLLDEYTGMGEGVDMYYVTALEQDLFLHLLSLNQKHMSPRVKLPPGPHSHKLDLSFLMPITKLSKGDIVRLSRNSGCLVAS